jgi:hypothetical protein
MIAYTKKYLENNSVIRKAARWRKKNLISEEQFGLIQSKYSTDLFSPNIFIKILLFIFSWIGMGAVLALYTTFFSTSMMFSGESYWVSTCFVFSVICFATLELMIKQLRLYRAGVDEALLYMGISFLLFSFSAMIDVPADSLNKFLFFLVLSFPFLAAAVVRYADTLLSIALTLCAYSILFTLILELGDIAKLIMPFVLMLASAPLYFFVKKQKQLEKFFYWKHCFIAAEYLALLVFYAACNYYVIRESSIAYFDMQLGEGEDIPLAFLFYFLTAIVPLLYIFYGLKKKDKIILWVGLLLVVAAALTFKNYFSLGHPEILLTAAGIILVLVAYFGIKYLKVPRHGITFDADDESFLNSNAEALIIAQSFSQQPIKPHDSGFGGGDFGGGGAGEKF